MSTGIPDDKLGRVERFFEMAGVRLNGSVDEMRLEGGVETLALPELRWLDFEEAARPASAVQDYYESGLELDQRALLNRWSGLNQARAIADLFALPFLERQAERVRRRMSKVGAGLDVTDPVYDEYFTNRMALLFDGLLEEEVSLLGSGREPARRKVMTEFGLQMEEYFRVSELKDRAAHIKNLEVLMKLSHLVKGKATEIRENRGELKTSMEELRARVLEVMSEQPVVAIVGSPQNALMPEVVVESVLVEGEVMSEVPV